MSMSIENIIYYPEMDIVSYDYCGGGTGVTTLRLFRKIYGVILGFDGILVFGTKMEAQAHALMKISKN